MAQEGKVVPLMLNCFKIGVLYGLFCAFQGWLVSAPRSARDASRAGPPRSARRCTTGTHVGLFTNASTTDGS